MIGFAALSERSFCIDNFGSLNPSGLWYLASPTTAAAAAEEDSQNTGGWGDFESYSTLGSQSATGGPSHCAVGDTSDSWADSQPPFDSSLHTDSESWSQ